MYSNPRNNCYDVKNPTCVELITLYSQDLRQRALASYKEMGHKSQDGLNVKKAIDVNINSF